VTEQAEKSEFANSIFNQTEPAVIVQGDWLADKPFTEILHASWEAQYAEYLGVPVANSLVKQLIANGEIHRHHAPLTIQATIQGKMVGIAALRPLNGISLITMLEVIPAKQGQGIGHQLITALETASNKLLTHVSIHRPTVKAFYASQGFHQLERTTLDHYGHALEFDVMAKS